MTERREETTQEIKMFRLSLQINDGYSQHVKKIVTFFIFLACQRNQHAHTCEPLILQIHSAKNGKRKKTV